MKKAKPTTHHRPIPDLLRGPASHLPPAVPITAQERAGVAIEFTMADGSQVRATIVTVWSDGVTLRREDTGTIQFLRRGDYTVAADEV